MRLRWSFPSPPAAEESRGQCSPSTSLFQTLKSFTSSFRTDKRRASSPTTRSSPGSRRSISARSRSKTSTPTLIDHSIELDGGREVQAPAARAARARRGGGAEGPEARPDRRALARLAQALPARDRQGAAADRRPGGLPGEADRARRHGREDADDRGQPAPGRLDREELPRPRPLLPRPDPGGLAGPDPRSGEVRLPQGLQVLDLRDLVDPPGRDAGDRRQGPHDPHPGAHGREAEQGRPHRAPARPAARAASRDPTRSPPSSR